MIVILENEIESVKPVTLRMLMHPQGLSAKIVDGEPLVYNVFGGVVSRQEIVDFIKIAQKYLEIYKTDADILHDHGFYCSDVECDECRQRKYDKMIQDKVSGWKHVRRKVVEPGFVYLAQFDDCFKIGTSTRVSARMKALRGPNGERAKLIAAIESDDRFADECNWHIFFVARHVEKELFALTVDDIELFVGCATSEVAA